MKIFRLRQVNPDNFNIRMVISNTVTVAWAIPVDIVTLGPQLEGYVECNDAISAFKDCIKRAHADASLGQLPPELVEIIATLIHQPIFEERNRWWQKHLRCSSSKCSAFDHDLSVEEILELEQEYRSGNDLKPDDSLDEGCWEDYVEESGTVAEKHETFAEDFSAKLGQGRPGTTPFTHHMKVLNPRQRAILG